MIVIVLVPIRNLNVLHNAPTVDLPLLSDTRTFCQGHVIDLLNCKEQFIPYGLLRSYYIYKSLVFPCAMMFCGLLFVGIFSVKILLPWCSYIIFEVIFVDQNCCKSYFGFDIS